jgi:hypothetical protein
VPSEGSCLMTMDPATMLPTAEFVQNGMPADAISRLVEIELREPDYTLDRHPNYILAAYMASGI